VSPRRIGDAGATVAQDRSLRLWSACLARLGELAVVGLGAAPASPRRRQQDM
jgi:hypothetical protein